MTKEEFLNSILCVVDTKMNWETFEVGQVRDIDDTNILDINKIRDLIAKLVSQYNDENAKKWLEENFD